MGRAYTADTFSRARLILAMTDTQNRAEFTPDSRGKTAIRGAKHPQSEKLGCRNSPRNDDRRYRRERFRKSSLVFDTLFAEGQRQYLNSLSIQHAIGRCPSTTERAIDYRIAANLVCRPKICLDPSS